MKIEIRIESALDMHAHYLLNPIILAWREAGCEIFVRSADEPPVDADVGLLHVDRSVVATATAGDASRYPVLNHGVLDIRKRLVSGQLVRRGDGYAGPVIVKTDLNCAGFPDRARALPRPRFEKFLRRTYRDLFRRAEKPILKGRYPIYEEPEHVPGWIWRNPALVVERFTPEREDGCYVLRNWVFLGDRNLCQKNWGTAPVVKSSNLTHFEPDPDPVPEAIRAARKMLRLDYGKIDWVMHEGRPIALDANKTPTVGNPSNVRFRRAASELAQGIRAFAT